MTPREVVLATRNVSKAVEFRALLAPLGWRVLNLSDVDVAYGVGEDCVESGATFEENALAKARYFAERCGGRAVLADDSGLCVVALGGAPGVYSRRYSGVEGDERAVAWANNARLLSVLAGVADRRATFVAALAYVVGSSSVVTAGMTAGRILEQPSGVQGFGYDPLFWSDELGCGFGDASEAEKSRVSHRARAVASLLGRLGAVVGASELRVDGLSEVSYTDVKSGA